MSCGCRGGYIAPRRAQLSSCAEQNIGKTGKKEANQKKGFKRGEDPTEIRTRIDRFKVCSADRYTIGSYAARLGTDRSGTALHSTRLKESLVTAQLDGGPLEVGCSNRLS